MFRLQQVHRWTTNKKTVPLGTVHFILVKSKKGSDHSEPLMSMAGVVGFEPTRGGFRIRCLNRTWLYPSPWCGERLELSWLSPQPPQGCASTNFATTAFGFLTGRDHTTTPRLFYSVNRKNFFPLGLAGVVGFEPTRGGFRIRCLNRTWLYPSPWCGRRDSNSHGSHHSHLKAARLPISPRPHSDFIFIQHVR